MPHVAITSDRSAPCTSAAAWAARHPTHVVGHVSSEIGVVIAHDLRRAGLPGVHTRTSIGHAAGIRPYHTAVSFLHRLSAKNAEAPDAGSSEGSRAKAAARMPHETICHGEVKDHA